jgi:hypothetical protein
MAKAREEEETIRVERDRSQRDYVKKKALLAEEAKKSIDSIFESLKRYSGYRRSLRASLLELPGFFGPIYTYERDVRQEEAADKLRRELEKFKDKEGLDLADGKRYLIGKEFVFLEASDLEGRAEKEGVVLITNDLIIIALNREGELVFYNALEIAELEVHEREKFIVLMVPPVVLTMKPLHGTMSLLRTHLKRKNPDPLPQAAPQKDSGYVEYLLAIKQYGLLPTDLSPYKGVLAESMEPSLSGMEDREKMKRRLRLFASIDYSRALDALFALERKRVEKKIKREVAEGNVVEGVSRILREHVGETERDVEEFFLTDVDGEREREVRAKLVIHLHSIHILAVSIASTYLYTDHVVASSRNSTAEETLLHLASRFVYPGYRFSYLSGSSLPFKNDYLKRRYYKNKEIISLLFAAL